MIDWDSKLPVIQQLQGKKSGPEIAKIIGVSIHALRWYCQRRNMSLALEGRKPRFLKNSEKKKTREIAHRIDSDREAHPSFGRLSIDVEKLWKISSINKRA